MDANSINHSYAEVLERSCTALELSLSFLPAASKDISGCDTLEFLSECATLQSSVASFVHHAQSTCDKVIQGLTFGEHPLIFGRAAKWLTQTLNKVQSEWNGICEGTSLLAEERTHLSISLAKLQELITDNSLDLSLFAKALEETLETQVLPDTISTRLEIQTHEDLTRYIRAGIAGCKEDKRLGLQISRG